MRLGKTAYVFHEKKSLRPAEADPETVARRPSPLSPRHQSGLVASYEREGEMHAGLEIYNTGRQVLDDDAYRSHSEVAHCGSLQYSPNESKYLAARPWIPVAGCR